MAAYFQVLIEEAKIVYEKLGPVKAFSSNAFITDLVPGIVMALMLGQVALLAAPVRSWIGNEYDEATLVEEVVVAVDARSLRIEEVSLSGYRQTQTQTLTHTQTQTQTQTQAQTQTLTQTQTQTQTQAQTQTQTQKQTQAWT